MLAVAPNVIARGVASYYPLEVGNSWHYATKKHTKVSQHFDVREADKHGTLEQRVLRASRLSTKRRKVFAVRNRVEESGSSLAPVVTVETILHVSSSAKGVLVYAIDSGGENGATLPQPSLILREPPSTEPRTARVGTLQLSVSVKSQTVEAVEVPAGKFVNALKQVARGPISGELSGLPVRSGTATEISWWVPNVGLVRQERTLDLTVQDERGVEMRLEEKAERVLQKFSTGKSDDEGDGGDS